MLVGDLRGWRDVRVEGGKGLSCSFVLRVVMELGLEFAARAFGIACAEQQLGMEPVVVEAVRSELQSDFNLLPPGQRARLPVGTRGTYSEPSEITPIYRDSQGVPTVHDATARAMDQFLTFTKRNGSKRVPARTLDYLFAASSVGVEKYGVRQDGTLELSDHLPVVAEFRLPG